MTTGQGLDVINTLTDKEVALIPVGDGPQGVAVDAATNRVYVVNVRDQTVSVIDGNANRVIDTITGFDYRPRLIAINPITNMIYVGNHGNGAGTTLAVINGSLTASFRTYLWGMDPTVLQWTPSPTGFTPANDTSNTVSVVNGSTNTVIATVPVGLLPRNIAVNIVTNLIYVSNSGSNTVSVIDGVTNELIRTIPVGDTPRGLSVNPLSNQVYLANLGGNSFSVIDGAADNVLSTIAVGQGPGSTAFDSTVNRAYVVNSLDASVSVVGNVLSPRHSYSMVWAA